MKLKVWLLLSENLRRLSLHEGLTVSFEMEDVYQGKPPNVTPKAYVQFYV